MNPAAKPKKSILKRSEPDMAGGASTNLADSVGGGRRHVPFSHILPELSHLEEDDDERPGGAGGDLQSVSSAASLSPLSSDDQLAVELPLPPSLARRRRSRPRPRPPPAAGRLSPLETLLATGALRLSSPSPPRPASAERRPPSGSPQRRVWYSPGPMRCSRSPLRLSPAHRSPARRSRSPVRRTPGRRSCSPARRSRSPVRRSRSPAWRSRSPGRRSHSPGRRSRSHCRRSRSPLSRRGAGAARHHRPSPPGRRHWSRSPSPKRLPRNRSRSRSISPPWGSIVERSLLALSGRPEPATGYGAGPGAGPGYPPAPYYPPGPAYLAYAPAVPYANPPGPGSGLPGHMPMATAMASGVMPTYAQPAYGAPVTPMYPPATQQGPVPPHPSSHAGGVGRPPVQVSERIGTKTFLREVEKRREQNRVLSRISQEPAGECSEKSTPQSTAGAEPKTAAAGPTSRSLTKLQEIKKIKPWMTEELLQLRIKMDEYKRKNDSRNKEFKALAKKWNALVIESKTKLELETKTCQTNEGAVTLSAATIARLTSQLKEYTARRDGLAGLLYQLKLDQKVLSNSDVIWKNGQPAANKKLHENLRKQGELLKELDEVAAVVAQLQQILDPGETLVSRPLNGVGTALLRAAQTEAAKGADVEPQIRYLLMGDDSLAAVQTYIREQESRATFGTELAAGQIRLLARADAAFSSLEFRQWVRASVRQSAAETLVLLASARCLDGGERWTPAAAAAPLLPLLRDLRAEGLTRAVVVGVPARPVASGGGGAERALQFNRELEQLVAAAGPHVPHVAYTPVKAGPQDGFGQQTEGGLTLDLYRTLLQAIHRCQQQTVVGRESGPVPPARPMPSVEEAADTLQSLVDALRGRLAGDEADSLSAAAELLDHLRAEPGRLDREQQHLDAEDPAVVFRDPADHVCMPCQQIFLNAKTYLEHLKSEEHVKKHAVELGPPGVPWRKRIPPVEKKAKNAESVPIKGLDMFIRVDCWYCKVCDSFVGDLRCASSHLKSRRHNAKYDEYLENNPAYHAMMGEARSRLLVDHAQREEEQTRRRRREEVQRRGDRLNEQMRQRRRSEGAVQDVTDEVGALAPATAAAPTTPPTVKKPAIQLNLLAAPARPADELGHLKEKVKANLAEQQARRGQVEAAPASADGRAAATERAAAKSEVERSGAGAQAGGAGVPAKMDGEEGASSGSAAAAASGGAKVKITLPERLPQKSAATAGAAARKKAAPMIGKLPKLRPKKPEIVKPAADASPPPGRSLTDSEKATVALAQRQESALAGGRPPPPAVQPADTEPISDDDVGDLLDIDLPDVDGGARADDAELRLLGICQEDVAVQKLPATRPPL